MNRFTVYGLGSRPSKYHFQVEKIDEELIEVGEGNLGDCCHQIDEEKASRIIQKIMGVKNHLKGARWGIQRILLSVI